MKSPKEKGFAAVSEVLALGILALGILSVVSVSNHLIRLSQRAELRVSASRVLDGLAAEVRAQPARFPEGVTQLEVVVIDEVAFRPTVAVAPAAGGLHDVVVTVRWHDTVAGVSLSRFFQVGGTTLIGMGG